MLSFSRLHYSLLFSSRLVSSLPFPFPFLFFFLFLLSSSMSIMLILTIPSSSSPITILLTNIIYYIPISTTLYYHCILHTIIVVILSYIFFVSCFVVFSCCFYFLSLFVALWLFSLPISHSEGRDIYVRHIQYNVE